MQNVVAITGHRPERIPDIYPVFLKLQTVFINHGVDTVIQGMAPGVDLTAARAAYHAKVPFICARPWTTHTARNGDWNVMYENALKYAAEVHVVTESDHYPGPWVYQKRNEWMVDRADWILSVWDGTEKGGTWNCIKYALDKQLTIMNIHPDTLELHEIT